jgi:mannose-6-phosphate isomerase-like protein (cupin superfamily)
MPFGDVNVDLSGSVDRTGKTNAVGQISFPSLNAGTYLLRFSGEGVVTFEREVTLKPKDIVKLAITLSVAEVPKPAAAPPPPPPPPPAPVVGPTGEPQIGSLTDALRQFRNTKERREIVLSCSGNTRNMLIVLTGEQPQRRYDGAESTYYVISGQGAAIIGKIESVIGEGSFITIPRGTPYSLGRTGNRPLALLWTLSGEPCESAR